MILIIINDTNLSIVSEKRVILRHLEEPESVSMYLFLERYHNSAAVVSSQELPGVLRQSSPAITGTVTPEWFVYLF